MWKKGLSGTRVFIIDLGTFYFILNSRETNEADHMRCKSPPGFSQGYLHPPLMFFCGQFSKEKHQLMKNPENNTFPIPPTSCPLHNNSVARWRRARKKCGSDSSPGRSLVDCLHESWESQLSCKQSTTTEIKGYVAGIHFEIQTFHTPE